MCQPDLADALAACGDLKITAAFSPQHGLRGDACWFDPHYNKPDLAPAA